LKDYLPIVGELLQTVDAVLSKVQDTAKKDYDN